MLIKVCEYNTSLEYHGYIIKIWDNATELEMGNFTWPYLMKIVLFLLQQ